MSAKNKGYKIAVDAMGGDFDPVAAVEGTAKILREEKNLRCKLFGDKDKIERILSAHSDIASRIEIIHAENVIAAHDRPSLALRKSKDTSMRLAIESVKNNETDAIVSSGNTGALMAISKVLLKMLPGISRPAIAALVPTITGSPAALVDAGANAECNEKNLFDFAIMGDAFAKIVFHLSRPRIALLNIGIEDAKGTEFIKAAMNKLKQADGILNICGFVEGTGIVDGSVDVIVTDGFTGNVALKTIEGTAKLCEEFLRIGFTKSWFSKLGYFFARSSLKSTFKKIDKRSYNGAMFIGINGIVVKSHGGADGTAFYYAMHTALDLIKNQINHKITEELQSYSVLETPKKED